MVDGVVSCGEASEEAPLDKPSGGAPRDGVGQVPTPSRWVSGGVLRLGALGRGARDMIDREVQGLCQRYPEVLANNSVFRRAQGRYLINGREVFVRVVTAEWLCEDGDDERARRCAAEGVPAPGRAEADGAVDVFGLREDCVVVRDGPLTQPFLDYVLNTGRNEEYDVMDSEKELREMRLRRTDSNVELEDGEVPYDPSDRRAAMSVARIEVRMRQGRRTGGRTLLGAPGAAGREPPVDDGVCHERLSFGLGQQPQAGGRPRQKDAGLISGRGMKALLAQQEQRRAQDYESRMAEKLLELRKSGLRDPSAAPDSALAPAAPARPARPEPTRGAAPRRRRLFGEVILPETAGLPPFEPEEENDAGLGRSPEAPRDGPSRAAALAAAGPHPHPSGVSGASRWRKALGLPLDLPASLLEEGPASEGDFVV